MYTACMTIFQEETIEITQEQISSWYPMLALPCYDQLISEPTVMSLLRVAMAFKEVGMKFSVCTLSDSLISRARNQMVAKFMANPEFTHIMFIDCDLAFLPDDIMKLLWHDKEVVTGAYPIKDINWKLIADAVKNGTEPEDLLEMGLRFVVNPVKDVENNRIQVENGAISVYDAGTGFMLIKRETIEKLIAEYPHLKYRDDTGGLTQEEGEWTYAFFNSYVDKDTGRFLSEDYGFCRYWQDMNGQIWTDPSIEMTHLGRLRYKATMINWLQRNATAG